MRTQAALIGAEVWRNIAACDAPPPGSETLSLAWLPKRKSLESDECIDASQGDGIHALVGQIVAVVRGGLRIQQADEWWGYWRDKYDDFVQNFSALTTLLRSRRMEVKSDDEWRESIARIGTARNERLQRAQERVRLAGVNASRFKRLQCDSLRLIDQSLCAAAEQFYWVYNIAFLSIHIGLVSEALHDGNVDLCIEVAEQQSLLLSDSVDAASSLRAVTPEGHALVEVVLEKANDGFGFIASIPIMQIETCGETAEETRDVAVQLVKDHLLAERKRGSVAFSDLLARLGLGGNSGSIALSIVMKTKGDMEFEAYASPFRNVVSMSIR